MTGEHMTPCVDCAEMVPTIRTGNGDPTLPRCPAQQARRHLHRVSRDVYDAARRDASA